MEAPMKKVQNADITFSTEDMLQDRKKHNRPLYLTGYIGETRLPRVQIDPGSAINVMPLRALAYLGIPTSRLSHTKVGTKPTRKEPSARFVSSAKQGI